MRRHPLWTAYLGLAIISIVWGTTWVVSRIGVQIIPALELAALRQIIAGLIFLIYFYFKGISWPTKKDIKVLVILAFLNFILSNGLSTWGIQYISAGLGAIIGAIFPFWLAIINRMRTKERFSNQVIMGMVMGFSGICLIFYPYLHDFLNESFRFGILLSFISTWSWAFGTVYTKEHAAIFNPYFGLGFQLTLSGVVLLVVSYASPGFVPLYDIPLKAWYSILYLVILGSIIGFGIYLFVLQRLPSEQVSIYAYINPIIALLLGAIWLDEPISLTLIIGSFIALFGVWHVNKAYVTKFRQMKVKKH